MTYQDYIATKNGLTSAQQLGKTSLKLGGTLLLSLSAVQMNAQVVITNVPAANQLVTSGLFPVNVDNAGPVEFSLSVVPGTSSFGRIYFQPVTPGIQFQGSGATTFAYPYKLAPCDIVDSSNQVAPALYNSITYGGFIGNWNNDPTVGYLGFQFNIGANVHYGWIELTITDSNPGPNSLLVTSWGYDATPNTAIPAGPGCTPLPVPLTNFVAEAKNGYNKLVWNTELEENNAGFEVQRSTDGTHFAKIGFVAATENSSNKNEYNFDDSKVDATTYHYRLKQLDNDGKFAYSQVVKVVSATIKDSHIEIFSNPVNDRQLRFNYHSMNTTRLAIDLYDMQGKSLFNQQSSIEAGVNSFDINLNDIPSGIYYLKCSDNQSTLYEKIVVN